MNIDPSGKKELPDEGRGLEVGVLEERQSPFPAGELKIEATNGVEKALAVSGLQGPRNLQVQQQPQGTGFCWERFLHVESIRVLLVENDDSTRHVVAALLRNCNYEVLVAANGLQAWKILENLNNRIDLVLTEVVMPYLPGIPLLSKIMSHNTRKNIPVIMMSSHDSMGLVFKCLSKGAVDFLVKPIRKNELKNLWQHVWRRCHSSSGSGSESGTQTQKSVKSKSIEKLNNSGSDDGDNDVSNGLNGGDGSDDGSGTQSSWTKQAAEEESSKAMSPIDQVAHCQDSTCGQVIRSNAENSGRKSVHFSVARGSLEPKTDAVAEGKDLEAVPHRNVELEAKSAGEIPLTIGSNINHLSEFNCEAGHMDEGQKHSCAEYLFSQHKAGIDEKPNPFIDGRENDSIHEVANILDNNESEPNVELSLKRHRGVRDKEKSIEEERFVLRRSEQSAFSRYIASSNSFRAPNGITGSSSVVDNRVEVAGQDSACGIQAHSTSHVIYLSSRGVGNNLDMGSTTNKLPRHASARKAESETTSINGVLASACRSIKNDFRIGSQQVNLLMHSDVQTTDLNIVRGTHQIQHPHHHDYRHHHRHTHNLEKQTSSNQDELIPKKLIADTQHCGSTNVRGGAAEGSSRNYSINRSASGSNHGSNLQNGSSPAVNVVGGNVENDGQVRIIGSGDASGSGSGNRVDEDKMARRTAALSKFRQKKKDRCFTKKVRYYNRKKLAEQRPRVRGQFVKQSETDGSNRTSDE